MVSYSYKKQKRREIEMEKTMFKYLSQEDIMGMNIPYSSVIETVERVMVSFGRGLCQCPPKPGVFTRDKSFLHAMPTYIGDTDICGIKWVAGYPANRDKNLPTVSGLIILNDAETGLPLAVMDCRWITAVRTAAVSAVAVKYCKVSTSDTMTVIGAGFQSRWNLLYCKMVAPELKKCYVNDINEANAAKFIKDMGHRVPDVELVPITGGMLKDSIAKSQIVLTATQNLPEPIVKFDMIHKGMLGIALEGMAWEDNIYTEGLDRFVCDDYALAESYQKKGSFQLGMPEKHYLLGRIANGTETGRANDDEVVIGFFMGMAISDIALAAQIYEYAKETGAGADLPLMEKEDIFGS